MIPFSPAVFVFRGPRDKPVVRTPPAAPRPAETDGFGRSLHTPPGGRSRFHFKVQKW